MSHIGLILGSSQKRGTEPDHSVSQAVPSLYQLDHATGTGCVQRQQLRGVIYHVAIGAVGRGVREQRISPGEALGLQIRTNRRN